MFVDPSVISLNATFNCLKQTTIWRPRTKTVLALSKSADEETITEIFRLCWQLKMLNTVAIAPDENRTVVGFNPFANQFYQPLNDTEIFYDKLVNLYGFKVNILLTKPDDPAKVRVIQKANNETRYTGKDGMAILSILQRHNATYGVLNIHEKLGWNNPFRSLHRNAKDDVKQKIFKEHNIDLFFLSQEMMLNNNITEMIYPHSKDDWVFMVPRVGFISKSDQLLRFFHEGFTKFLIFFLLICPLIWFVIRVIEAWLKGQRHSKFASLVNLFFENFKMILGGSADAFFPNFTEKFFLIVLCSCYVVINNYFQSILVSIVTVQTRGHEVNTIDDMIASDFVATTVKNMMLDIAQHYNNTRQAGILKKLRLTQPRSMPSSFLGIRKSFYPNMSIIVNYDRAKMWTVTRPHFRICKESPLPAYISFQVVKDSPFFDLVAKSIPRFLETGLYQFWTAENLFLEILQEGIVYDEEDQDNFDVKRLTLHQFRAGLYLLFLGLVLSTSVFIVELVYRCIRRCCCNGEIRTKNI